MTWDNSKLDVLVNAVVLQNTEYKNGYSADHPAVRMFWSVFHEDMSLEDKKKFLRKNFFGNITTVLSTCVKLWVLLLLFLTSCPRANILIRVLSVSPLVSRNFWKVVDRFSWHLGQEFSLIQGTTCLVFGNLPTLGFCMIVFHFTPVSRAKATEYVWVILMFICWTCWVLLECESCVELQMTWRHWTSSEILQFCCILEWTVA